jgi:hypothetical protein
MKDITPAEMKTVLHRFQVRASSGFAALMAECRRYLVAAAFCLQCQEAFVSVMELKYHVESACQHQDPLASSGGGQPRPLLATHVKPYKCALCNMGFNREQLAQHMGHLPSR